MNKLGKILILILGDLIVFSSRVHASAIQESAQYAADKLGNILNFLYSLFFIAVAGAALYVGFLFVAKADDPQEIKKAKNYIVYIIIATILALIAGGAAAIIASFTQ